MLIIASLRRYLVLIALPFHTDYLVVNIPDDRILSVYEASIPSSFMSSQEQLGGV